MSGLLKMPVMLEMIEIDVQNNSIMFWSLLSPCATSSFFYINSFWSSVICGAQYMQLIQPPNKIYHPLQHVGSTQPVETDCSLSEHSENMMGVWWVFITKYERLAGLIGLHKASDTLKISLKLSCPSRWRYAKLSPHVNCTHMHTHRNKQGHTHAHA